MEESVVVTPPALISCAILKSKCRLSVARSPMPADEMALRTFVLMNLRYMGVSDKSAAWTIVQLGLLGINPDH